MKYRVFIAHMISNRLGRKIFEIQKKYTSPTLRQTSVENLHITLVPPWYVYNTTSIIKTLSSEVQKYKPFQINFTELLLGPNKKHPRLIWITASTSAAFETLTKKLNKVLERTDEERKLVPHVTIARFIKHTKPDLAPISQELNWHEEISSVSLIASYLQKGGARYEILETWKFS